MCDAQHFCLKWNSFPDSMLSALEILWDDEDFVDVTLACDKKSFKAHKVVLSACSQYFRSLLKDNPCQHPIIILQDVGAEELNALLQFMYHGQANVEQQLLPSLLQAAAVLQIKGLSEISQQAKEWNQNQLQPVSCELPSIEPLVLNQRSSSPLSKKKKELPMLQSILTSNRLSQEPPSLLPSSHLMPSADFQETEDSEDGIGPPDYSDDDIPPVIIKEEFVDDDDSMDEGRMDSTQNFVPRSPKGSILPTSSLVSSGDSTLLSASAKLHQAAVMSQDQPRKLAFHEPRPCPVCKRVYRDAATLRTHTAIMHVEGITPFYCSCGAPFRTKYEMYMHKKNGHK